MPLCALPLSPRKGWAGTHGEYISKSPPNPGWRPAPTSVFSVVSRYHTQISGPRDLRLVWIWGSYTCKSLLLALAGFDERSGCETPLDSLSLLCSSQLGNPSLCLIFLITKRRDPGKLPGPQARDCGKHLGSEENMIILGFPEILPLTVPGEGKWRKGREIGEVKMIKMHHIQMWKCHNGLVASTIPNIHMSVHNHPQGIFTIFWPPHAPNM